MDIAAPVVLFALGFGAAFLARGAVTWKRRDRGLQSLPTEEGAVRLGLLWKGSGKKRSPLGTVDRKRV